METFSLTNRYGKKIVGNLSITDNQRGLVFILHGVGGFKEQPHIEAMAEEFQKHRYTTVVFDSTSGLGESDGGLETVTFTGNYEDLEDVIAWASSQQWHQEPFVLAGHSLGSFCVALYAEKFPDKVKALAPISTVVSGRLLMTSPDMTKIKGMWEETKWFISDSSSRPGTVKRIPWSFVRDVLRYDLLPDAKSLTMQVLLAVGDGDPTTTVAHQKKLFKALPDGKKEFHIITGAYHTFRTENTLKQLRTIVDQWIRKIE